MEHSSIKKSLSFDDVLIKPARSSVLPSEVSTFTKTTSNISLGVPLISSAMDTVTEYKLAIAIAQSGGMGILHKNMSIDEQSQNVSKVKKFETGMVIDPLTILPSATLADALELMKVNEISGIPVVDEGDKLLGILTNRDVRFATNMSQKISELMTSKNLVTVKDGISTDDAQKLLHKHRIEKLLVVDDKGKYKLAGRTIDISYISLPDINTVQKVKELLSQNITIEEIYSSLWGDKIQQ